MTEIKTLSPKKVMFCFVTEQNVTNAIPALLLNVDILIPVFTFRAFKSKWGLGLEKVWNNFVVEKVTESNQQSEKAKNESIINEKNSIHLKSDITAFSKWEKAADLESDVNGISSLILQRMTEINKKFHAEFFINIGGGTKLHTLALNLAYNKYDGNSNISLVYINSLQDGTLINRYKKPGDEFKSEKLYEIWPKMVRLNEHCPKTSMTVKKFITLYNRTYEKDRTDRALFNYHYLEDKDCREFLAFKANSIDDSKRDKITNALTLLKEPECSKQIIDNIHQFIGTINGQTTTFHEGLADNKKTSLAIFKKIFETRINTTFREVKLNKGSNLSILFKTETVLANNDNFIKWKLKEPVIASNGKSAGMIMEYFVADKISKAIENSSMLADIEFGLDVKNLSLKKEKVKSLGEFDILILTKDGQLICLDVKNTKYENNSYLADKYKLRIIGGAFVSHFIIVPLFIDDIESDYFKEEKVPYKVIKDLNENGIPFSVFTNRKENKDNNFWLVPPKNNHNCNYDIVFDKKTADDNGFNIECKTTTTLFQELGLLETK
jgi:hypothetical protein